MADKEGVVKLEGLVDEDCKAVPPDAALNQAIIGLIPQPFAVAPKASVPGVHLVAGVVDMAEGGLP